MVKSITDFAGHKIKVREYPSRVGLAKLRSHFKRKHPKRFAQMIRKSLMTKLRKGRIRKLTARGRRWFK